MVYEEKAASVVTRKKIMGVWSGNIAPFLPYNVDQRFVGITGRSGFSKKLLGSAGLGAVTHASCIAKIYPLSWQWIKWKFIGTNTIKGKKTNKC